MTIERIPIVNRVQWLGLRAHDVTASDVPAVCGEGLYGSAAKVWAEKRGLIPPAEMTEAMKRGRWGEAAVFEALADEHTDWELRRAKVYLRDPSARLGATPDGVALVPGRDGVVIVQAKVIIESVFKRDWLVDGETDVQSGEATPPLAYQLQTLTEMMLSDATCGVLAVLVVGYTWTLRTFWIERHPDAEQMIRSKVAAFWANYLDAGVPPPIDPERDEGLVRMLYPRDDGTEIDLRGDNAMPGLVDARADIKARIKLDEDHLETVECDIKGKLGSHTYGRLADGRVVSWKLQDRKGYEVKAISFRVLRVTGAKTAR
jgi:predicted phage-related endonuclease